MKSVKLLDVLYLDTQIRSIKIEYNTELERDLLTLVVENEEFGVCECYFEPIAVDIQFDFITVGDSKEIVDIKSDVGFINNWFEGSLKFLDINESDCSSLYKSYELITNSAGSIFLYLKSDDILIRDHLVK